MRKAVFSTMAAVLLFSQYGAHADELLDIDQYAGKVVVVDFWASWCVPCRRSFPWWNQMRAKYEDRDLVIIGVNLDNDREEAEKFLREFPADFEIYFDKDKQLAKEFDVRAMPSTYVIGRNGELADKHFGFKVKLQNEYEARLVEALQTVQEDDS